MKSVVISLILLSGIFYLSNPSPLSVAADRSVNDVLEELGEYDQSRKPDFSLKGVSAEVGEKLVKEGFYKGDGRNSKKQSKHFVCTSCHNVVKEEVDLANPDPQSRLEYTNDIGVPFLQGTTLHGAVNRESFYNGDYDKKYGDLVKPARYDLRGAIQLCAIECAQGRELADWEIESILAYLWEIDLKMSDLIFTPDEIATLEEVDNSRNARERKIEIIKSKYKKGADAHFVVPPFDRSKGYEGVRKDPQNGKMIYENSCLHCHENQRYSYLHLDNSRMSFKHLNKKMSTYHPHSLYQVARWGVPVKSGRRSYMPQYTEEKMTNQQLEDLRAYIHIRAKG